MFSRNKSAVQPTARFANPVVAEALGKRREVLLPALAGALSWAALPTPLGVAVVFGLPILMNAARARVLARESGEAAPADNAFTARLLALAAKLPHAWAAPLAFGGVAGIAGVYVAGTIAAGPIAPYVGAAIAGLVVAACLRKKA